MTDPVSPAAAAKPSAAFLFAFTQTVAIEGVLTTSPNDKGNWTGGAIGKGTCKGTKWGISAAAYPTLDIANLTQADAEAIYFRDFWPMIRGDDLPPALAALAFDAAVNNGERAKIWLQAAAAVAEDGQLGAETMAAIAHLGATTAGIAQLCCEFQARRLDFEALLPNWRTFGLGWSRRLCSVLSQSLALAHLPPASASAGV